VLPHWPLLAIVVAGIGALVLALLAFRTSVVPPSEPSDDSPVHPVLLTRLAHLTAIACFAIVAMLAVAAAVQQQRRAAREGDAAQQLEARIGALEDRVGALVGHANAADGRVAAIDGRVSTLDRRVSVVETRTRDVEARTTGSKDRVGNVEVRVGSLETRMAAVDARLAALQSAIRDASRMSATSPPPASPAMRGAGEGSRALSTTPRRGGPSSEANSSASPPGGAARSDTGRAPSGLSGERSSRDPARLEAPLVRPAPPVSPRSQSPDPWPRGNATGPRADVGTGRAAASPPSRLGDRTVAGRTAPPATKPGEERFDLGEKIRNDWATVKRETRSAGNELREGLRRIIRMFE